MRPHIKSFVSSVIVNAIMWDLILWLFLA